MLSTVGNTAVIIHQLKNLIGGTEHSSQIAFTNRILVLNLAVADLLVGVSWCHGITSFGLFGFYMTKDGFDVSRDTLIYVTDISGRSWYQRRVGQSILPSRSRMAVQHDMFRSRNSGVDRDRNFNFCPSYNDVLSNVSRYQVRHF